MSIRFGLFFGLRYLVSKSRMGAINWITRISAVAIAVVVAALVVVLSVFNGYVDLILAGAEHATPDLIIEPRSGHKLALGEAQLSASLQAPEVAQHSAVLRSQGLLRSEQSQQMAEVYGIDKHYPQVVSLDSALWSGRLPKAEGDQAIEALLGVGLNAQGGIFVDSLSQSSSLSLVFPRRKGMINPLAVGAAFVSEELTPVGVLSPMSEVIDRRLFVPITALRSMLSYEDDEASFIALSVTPGYTAREAQQSLQERLGENYRVLSREEQQPELTFLIKSERLMTYAIMLFVLVLAAFNLASSLVMLILEKQGDLSTLYALGATRGQRISVFVATGFMVSLLGCVAGLVLGLGVSWGQASFGWISSGQGALAMPFPIVIAWSDIAWIFITTALISLLTSSLPALFIKRG